MKKPMALLLMLLLLLGTAGCTASNSKSTTEPVSTSAMQAKAPNLQSVQTKYGAQSEAGWYSLERVEDDGQHIWFADFQTMQNRLLCEDATCAHQDESCTAWLPYSQKTELVAAEDGLLRLYCGEGYTDGQAVEENENARIEWCDAHGENVRVVTRFEPGEVIVSDVVVLAGDTVYVMITQWDGNRNGTSRIVAVGLQQGGQRVLKEFEGGEQSYTLMGATKEALVVQEARQRIDPETGFKVDDSYAVHTLQLDGTWSQPLAQYTREDTAAKVLDGKLFTARQDSAVYVQDLADPQAENLLFTSLPEPNLNTEWFTFQSYTDGKLVFECRFGENASISEKGALYLSDGGGQQAKLLPLMFKGLEPLPVIVIGQTAQDFIVLSGLYNEADADNHGPKEAVVSLISKQDFFNGAETYRPIQDFTLSAW